MEEVVKNALFLILIPFKLWSNFASPPLFVDNVALVPVELLLGVHVLLLQTHELNKILAFSYVLLEILKKVRGMK